MTTDPEPILRFERFPVTYPSGTVIESFYTGGADRLLVNPVLMSGSEV